MLMDVDVFIPCYIDQLFPDTGFNTIKVLEKLGVTVHYNENQTCCGQPAFNGGYFDEAYHVAKKFMADFNGNRPVVVPSSSCVKMIREHYRDLFGDSALRVKYQKLKGTVFELVEFITHVLNKDDVGAEFNAKVTYHDSCSAVRGLHLKDEPRQLLKKVKGLQLVEMNESDTCCGFGGTFSVKMEPISSAMAEQKLDNAAITGAEYIVGTDVSCLMHLNGYARKNKYAVKMMHIADVLAQGY